MVSGVFIAFGSNLADPVRQLVRARARLNAVAGLTETGASRLYRSAPWGFTEQADFYNAVCRYDCQLPPLELLSQLQQLEQEQGRERPFKNAPRTLDLDILLYGHKNMAHPLLTIPHPAMLQRVFVLAPALDINPQLTLPAGDRLGEALAALSVTGLAVVGGRDWQLYHASGEENHDQGF